MTAARWGAFTVAVLAIVFLFGTPNGPATVALSAVLLVAFIVVCWTAGAFSRGVWIADIPEGHPDALGSLDLLERHGPDWGNPDE